MGQKVNPIGFRLGITARHSANWYAEGRAYKENLLSDMTIRHYLDRKMHDAPISRVDIERMGSKVNVIIHSGRPAQIVGRKGEHIEKLRTELAKEIGISPNNLTIEAQAVARPDANAVLVAQNIARQLEQRIMFRRAMRRAVNNAREAGVEGIRVQISGRLGGADIARTERYLEGRVPLHTLRAHIDYGQTVAKTVYGVIGVKVWIFSGEENALVFAPRATEES